LCETCEGKLVGNAVPFVVGDIAARLDSVLGLGKPEPPQQASSEVEEADIPEYRKPVCNFVMQSFLRVLRIALGLRPILRRSQAGELPRLFETGTRAQTYHSNRKKLISKF